MAGILAYLMDYSTVSHRRTPFGEVDMLVFSQMSYVDFRIAVGPSPLPAVAAASTAPLLLNRQLLGALACSNRFADVLLTEYVNDIDIEVTKQFSAVTALLPDGTVGVFFRGTDGTIAGWKEDFNLAFATPVPAQVEAVRYLNRVAQRYPGPIRVAGHSKGGNLAVYAAAMAEPETQNRLLDVYSFDGPGHDMEMLRSAGYARVANRIRSYIPQSSIVGMLLEHSDDYTVVRSNSSGIFQHLPFTWQVENGVFLRLPERTGGSVRLNDTIRGWIAGMSAKRRREFTDALFDTLSMGGAVTEFSQLSQHFRQSSSIAQSIARMDPEDGKILAGVLKSFLETAYQVYRQSALESVSEWRQGFARAAAEISALCENAKGDVSWANTLLEGINAVRRSIASGESVKTDGETGCPPQCSRRLGSAKPTGDASVKKAGESDTGAQPNGEEGSGL